jgi:hypothetical protein
VLVICSALALFLELFNLGVSGLNIGVLISMNIITVIFAFAALLVVFVGLKLDNPIHNQPIIRRHD